MGVHLPAQIRANDWWPREIVEQWRQRSTTRMLRMEEHVTAAATEGERRTLAAIARMGDDPFLGTRERRVLDASGTATDMEVAAAKEALDRARVDAGEIDLLLYYSTTPQYALAPEFGLLHKALGLPRRCMSVTVDTVCNSFPMQLTLALQVLAGGRARNALLVQTALHSRLAPMEDVSSAIVGDGATAVVVGAIAEGRGVLGYSHSTDGSFHGGLVCGVPGGTWYDPGQVMPWTPNPGVARKMGLSLVDWAKQSVDEALAEAGVRREEIAFYACHQSTPWLRPVTQEYLGLTNARSVDSYAWTGNLMACNVPLQLALGEREGALRDGDLVATFTMSNGATWTGMVMRWGA